VDEQVALVLGGDLDDLHSAGTFGNCEKITNRSKGRAPGIPNPQ
jgi:hypothetical protein